MNLKSDWSLITQIDSGNHRCLSLDDCCYYYKIKERSGDYSDVSSIIFNFKKKPNECIERYDLRNYKEKAIQTITNDLISLFADISSNDNKYLLVPAITSIPRSSLLFDNRLEKVCENVAKKLSFVDTFNLLDIKQNIQKAHYGGSRDIEKIYSNIAIDNSFDISNYDNVYIFDDVITTGAHFKACQKIIKETFNIVCDGIFWARSESIDEQQKREYLNFLNSLS